MTLDRPVLADGYDIALRSRRAYVERRRDGQPVAALAPAEAVALALLDGRRTIVELTETLIAAAGPRARGLVDTLAGRLAPLLATVRSVSHRHGLGELSQALPPDPDEGLRLLPGPRVLHWAVTDYCPRRCAYCYAEPKLGGKARDSTITFERIQEVLEEAASLGARTFLLQGAEPLLREDVPEIMGVAAALGIDPVVTTKRPIGPSLACRLAAAGVAHVSLSVDTLDPVESRALIGSAAYPGQVRRSVACLTRAGVAFSVQAVATRMNAGAFEELAAFAAASGAKVLQVVPFEPVRKPLTRASNDDLALCDREGVARLVDRLANRHPGTRIELFDKESSSRAAYHCDIGQTKMFFRPNGMTHRCYKLTEDRRLDGADLRVVSVAAAWHDSHFRDVISPPSARYEGSACSTCTRFANCHDSGRCIYQALVDHGRYESPDRPCGKSFSGSADRATR